MESIEALVLDALESKLLEVDDNTIAEISRAHINAKLGGVRDQLASVTKELQQTDSALRRNQAQLERALDGKEIGYYEARIRELLRQQVLQLERKEDFERQLKAGIDPISEEAVRAARGEWSVRWAEAPLEKKRAMLADGVRAVVWHPDTKSVDVVIGVDWRGTSKSGSLLYAE